MNNYGYVDVGKLADYANNTTIGLTANDIMRFPKADVQPVKRGKWEQLLSRQSGFHYEVGARCSYCNEYAVTVSMRKAMPFEFCPHCTADMRGDTELREGV